MKDQRAKCGADRHLSAEVCKYYPKNWQEEIVILRSQDWGQQDVKHEDKDSAKDITALKWS